MNKIENLKIFAKGGSIRKAEGGMQFDLTKNKIIVDGLETDFDPKNADHQTAKIEAKRAGRKANAAAYGDYLKEGAQKTLKGLAQMSGVNTDNLTQRSWTDSKGKEHKGMSVEGQEALGIGADVFSKATDVLDDTLMGDKNFGAQSAAIDSAVHGASGALMKSGNPYAMAAGAALEGINFLTKAGGQTVEGYNVDINNAGYGNLGHMESSSSRDFLGLNSKNVLRKLDKRNEQARMALSAASISADNALEQEARAKANDNVLRQNRIALSGGIDTSLLAN